MWNGAPGSMTASAAASASANGSTLVNAPSDVACMCAKSSTGRTHPHRREISTTSSALPSSRTRPITSMPKGTARSLPSSRERSSPSCSQTEAIASSRLFCDGTRAGPKRISPMEEEVSTSCRGSVRPALYGVSMARRPSRIDLLELDIDLRLADLWREAGEITDWNLEVVAAFMRASYGKGYCDALTEESPGSLCLDHGYRIPDRTHPAAADA